MEQHITGLVRVEYVRGFYFAVAETFNHSAEVLRDVIQASQFAASEFKTVENRLALRGYQLISVN